MDHPEPVQNQKPAGRPPGRRPPLRDLWGGHQQSRRSGVGPYIYVVPPRPAEMRPDARGCANLGSVRPQGVEEGDGKDNWPAGRKDGGWRAGIVGV
jgi:hypothetical protein